MKRSSPRETGIGLTRSLLGISFTTAGLFLAVLAFASNRSAPVTAPQHLNVVRGMAAPQTVASGFPPGSWSIVPSPNTSAAENNFLSGVACISSTQCWAVGSSRTGSLSQTLIEHWDGSAWTIVPSPNTSTTQTNRLYDVTCPSASECWAVGTYKDSTASHTLVEHWDGTSWAIVSSPDVGSAAADSFLFSVSCPSALQCWAVGYSLIGNSYFSLIELWDGVSWTIVPSVETNVGESNFLTKVTCPSALQCWAVGYSYSSNPSRTLIEVWNGAAWTSVPSPNLSDDAPDFLFDVTCTSASQCWAVGYSYSYVGMGIWEAIIERWDGTSWSIVTPPGLEYRNSYLASVTCLSDSQCWAVGRYEGVGTGLSRTLILEWDGVAWSVKESPNIAANQSDRFADVLCTSAFQCWAVGDYYNGSVYQTLIARYTPSLTIGAVGHPSSDHFAISGEAVPLSSINIQASPDLVSPFETIGMTTTDANGAFQYDDATADTQRFYRAAYP